MGMAEAGTVAMRIPERELKELLGRIGDEGAELNPENPGKGVERLAEVGTIA